MKCGLDLMVLALEESENFVLLGSFDFNFFSQVLSKVFGSINIVNSDEF